jgi:hypothetical protein
MTWCNEQSHRLYSTVIQAKIAAMNDKELTSKFKTSWDEIERFYDYFIVSHPGYEWLLPIKGLIRDIRARGYDQHLRAGQALHSLVLSRSREHGLRFDQPRLSIWPLEDGQMEVHYASPLFKRSNVARMGIKAYEETTAYWDVVDRKACITLDSMKLCPELQQLLDRLLAHEID